MWTVLHYQVRFMDLKDHVHGILELLHVNFLDLLLCHLGYINLILNHFALFVKLQVWV